MKHLAILTFTLGMIAAPLQAHAQKPVEFNGMVFDPPPTQGYGYDAFNRLSSVTVNGAQVGDYRNNAFNQRVLELAEDPSLYLLERVNSGPCPARGLARTAAEGRRGG